MNRVGIYFMEGIYELFHFSERQVLSMREPLTKSSVAVNTPTNCGSEVRLAVKSVGRRSTKNIC